MRGTGVGSRVVQLTAAVALGAGGLFGLAALAPSAGALTTFTVDNATDVGAGVPANCTTPVAGQCRLVDALAAADATDDDVVIQLAVPGGVIAASGDSYNGGVGANHALTIEGNGQTIDDSANNTTALDINAGSQFTANNVTVSSGFTPIGSSITSTITNSTLTAVVSQPNVTAQGYFGGGGSVTMTNTTITAQNTNNNDAVGVEVLGGGSITFTNSSATVTAPEGEAVGLTSGSGSVTMTGSTVSASGATDGTGVHSGGQIITVTNSTVTGSNFNGIETDGSVVNLVYATVVGNATEADTHNVVAETLNTFGSVIAQPGSGNTNCEISDSTASSAFDYSDDADSSSSCMLADPTDRIGASNNPLLGALAANGGPTQTLLPQTGSPLIDGIPTANCQDDGASGITVDQRGQPRPSMNGCDIGSVEVQAVSPPAPPSPPPSPSPPPVVIQPAFTG
jgi:hypothetical protein